MAARLRRELNVEVEMIQGRYGEFKVLVDGQTIIDGGSAAFLGVLPPGKKISAAVRDRISQPTEAAD